MANPTQIAILVGTVVFVIGLMMIRSHRRAWHDQKNDSALPDADRDHLYRRYRRRMQTSGTMVLLGLLLAVGGGEFVPWNQFPQAFAIYWICVLLLTVWVILQALGDMLSTGARAKVSLAEVRAKQRELERQLAEHKSRRSNGRHVDN